MDDGRASELARALHRALEPVHTLVYFAAEPGERYAEAGVRGTMRGYFASRSAPLGRVPAEVVVATFYNFAARAVEKAIPSVWESTSPEAMIEARFAGAEAALRRLLPALADSPELDRAVELARLATAGCSVQGRPLYAAHAALAWPQSGLGQLFHAATLLREHRGDGHIAALVLAGLSGVQAVVSHVATGNGLPEQMLRATRGYTEDEWAAARDNLRGRGWLDDAGALTPAGMAARTELEAMTDRAAAGPCHELGAERCEQLVELVRPWSRSINAQLFG